MPPLSESNRQGRIFLLFFLALLQSLLSCGGDVGPDPAQGSGQGTVALYVTDNISFYKQLIAKINEVRLVNSGTGDVCSVLRSPVTLDISNLTNMAQYVDLALCRDGSYNRIDVGFDRGVLLMDQLGASSTCQFSSYLDANGDVRNLSCDEKAGTCTVSIAGGTRGGSFLIQEDQLTVLGIDFDLKKFTVQDFGGPACSTTMAASLLTTADMNNSGRAYGVTGTLADLDTVAETFTLNTTGASLTVHYANINAALQPDLDDLLLLAQSEGLRANILTGGIDLPAGSIDASRIYVKAEGTVSGVTDQPQWTFLLTYGQDKMISGTHKPPADVQGPFADGAWVNVKFKGYDRESGRYEAAAIEVLPADTILDD